MGYSTTYTITRVDGDLAVFRRAFEMYHQAKPDESERWFGLQVEHTSKWYDHEDQLKGAMSVAAGVTAVHLHLVGEDHGDVWDKEFTRTTDGKIVVKKYRYRLVREEHPS